jgi:bacillithiol biosynthesis cysteine-adding enzyme BshC
MRVEIKRREPFYNPKDRHLFAFDPANSSEGRKAIESLSNQSFLTGQVKELIQNYNTSLDNSIVIDKPHFVITGQQLGFMGGPCYTILKGITCLQVAKALGATPLFWLATEDHDVSEINHTYLIDAHGNFDKYRLNLARNGTAVEDLPFSSASLLEMERFLKNVHLSFSEGIDYSSTMARFLVKLFAGTGMVFLEPKILRPLQAPFFQKEVDEAAKIQEILKKSADALGESPFGLNTTNLFLKVNGIRKKIEKREDLFFAGTSSFTKSELLQLPPERFSTNAAARCVLQSSLLPTAAYIAGPGEFSYWRHLLPYFTFHGVQMPWVVPRISATFIPIQGQKWLREQNLNPWDPIPDDAKASVRHLFSPYGKPQERVINFCQFQCPVRRCLEFLDWKSQGHHFCFLEDNDSFGW